MAYQVQLLKEAGVDIILLKDSVSGTEAEIYARGALLNAFRVPGKNGIQNLIAGFSGPGDAEKNITQGFRSAKMSPYVCRLRNGSYTYRDQPYKVQKHYLGRHAIHGLLYDAVFTIIDMRAGEGSASVTMVYSYQGIDPGYPFPYNITVHWHLEAGNRLTVHTAIEHNNPHPIPVADGWHPYFQLGGVVDEWTLQFDSHEQFAFDEDLLPTGSMIPDQRFITPVPLEGIELDNSFLLTGKEASCVLANHEWQLEIEPLENYPVLQVYIPAERTSIAIENLSGVPDNFNNGIRLLEPEAGEVIRFSTRYTVLAL
jgi:aldose 1-epimerase